MSSPSRDDERRLFEMFVIAGLDRDSPEELSPSSQECGCRNAQPLAPITDICVVFPSLGESMPEGFEMIDTTPLGYAADLNHGSLRMPSVFIGFRRGYHKPPLVDIGVLDQGRGDKPMVDANTVQTTPFGRPANVNNASQGIFLTYRRAQPNSAPSQFVVTHICVILGNKGEVPPHTYYKIPKNLNKGMVGSDVYICYKKSQGSSKRIAYKPTVLDYFPRSAPGAVDDNQLRVAQNTPLFCLPMGALIECWPVKCQPPDKSFTTFVLTDEDGTKFYGAAVSFYERYTDKLSDEQMDRLELSSNEGGAVEDNSSNNDPADQLDFHANSAICLISRYPFFHSFKRFLYYIHRMSLEGGIHSVPIERYLSHLKYEVSFPTPRRPRVLMSLGAEQISFESHDDSQLPLNGAQLFDALKSLGPDNLMYLMLLALLEQKILVHSLRSWMLTAVSESICALMFPFHWQCPYVPQCPLGLAGMLHAPLPFIAGVDSRYFELYEDPPEDVTCFDLDTSTISWSTARQSVRLSILPKKASKQLKNSLENLARKISMQNFEVSSMQRKNEFVPVDVEFQFQKKKKEIEMEIQDAFLRFMAHLMRGYQSYLRPIKCAPASVKATDTGNLFDKDGFLRSRDKSGSEFFKRFSETQSFMRFIEERSFVSDKNAYNAFFDDTMAKVISSDGNADVPLLESDSSLSEKHPSVFIAPPEAIVDPTTGVERQFIYHGFPRKLDPSLFQLDQLNMSHKSDSQRVPVQHEMTRCAAVRTKPEVRSSHLAATNAVKTNQMQWPKTLLFYAYSLWFMQLPSLLSLAPNKKKILRLAFHVLDRLEQSGVVLLDQVCYRILIQICGDSGEPALAVKVLQAMQRTGLEQNAVTYGIYHRAVMDATWPTEARQRANKAWSHLRLAVRGVAQFRSGFIFAKRPPVDTQSVSDGGYQSDKPCEDQKESLAAYTISYHDLDHSRQSDHVKDESGPSDPLMGGSANQREADPLGADSLTDAGISAAKISQMTMSPSRAKFLAEHSSSPFASEPEVQQDNKSGSRTGSWFKGITNSPFMKMIRSQTFESPKPMDNGTDGPAVNVSPSLQSLVTHVRKGYDDVVKEGVSSKFRLGVSSLVHEVRSLNRSYGNMGSGTIFGEESTDVDPNIVDEDDPVYQLDNGYSGSLLSEAWWLSEVLQQLRRNQERERASDTDTVAGSTDSSSTEGLLEVTISNCTACPHCHRVIYDEEIMAGWKVDDQNLNTICPHCASADPPEDGVERSTVFVPQLTVQFKWKKSADGSWYPPGGLQAENDAVGSTDPVTHSVDSLSVAFVSPLVLRRELETLLAVDLHVLKERTLMETHPVIFWNLVFYMRRLGLPTHLNSFIAPRHHIRCVYDRPALHTDAPPLYFLNPNNVDFGDDELKASRSLAVWRTVTQSVQDNKLFTALQALINDSRRVTDSGQVALGNHFPVFRDIQFACIDMFGRSLVRDSLDRQFPTEWTHLPVRIRNLLPSQDRPQLPLHRACRKIFLPLDLL